MAVEEAAGWAYRAAGKDPGGDAARPQPQWDQPLFQEAVP